MSHNVIQPTKVNERRKRPAKASTKQRIACFLNALPDLNPKYKR